MISSATLMALPVYLLILLFACQSVHSSSKPSEVLASLHFRVPKKLFESINIYFPIFSPNFSSFMWKFNFTFLNVTKHSINRFNRVVKNASGSGIEKVAPEDSI